MESTIKKDMLTQNDKIKQRIAERKRIKQGNSSQMSGELDIQPTL